MEPKRWKIIITSSLICMYSVMRANGVQENRSRRCPNPLINVYTHRRICCRSSRPLPPPSPLGFRDFGNSHSPDVFCNMRMVILQMITSDCLFSIRAHMGLRKNRASGLQLEESCVCKRIVWCNERLTDCSKEPKSQESVRKYSFTMHEPSLDDYVACKKRKTESLAYSSTNAVNRHIELDQD